MSNVQKTSLYIPWDLKREVEIHCINQPEKIKLNDFFLEAIKEKLKKDGGLKK